jgi:RNA polymerase sigma-70 factor (ECF subfamily)
MSLRKKRPETVSFDVPSTYETEPQEPLQIVDWCCLPEEEFLTAEGRMRLDEAAEQLPDSLRVVFVLRDIEGLSTRETAEVLDISEMAVKTRLSRARLRLREDLSRYFGKLVAKE